MLVEPENPEALAAALRQLFTDRARAAQLGEQARAHVRQRLCIRAHGHVVSRSFISRAWPPAPFRAPSAPRPQDLNHVRIAGRFNFDPSHAVSRCRPGRHDRRGIPPRPVPAVYYLDGSIGLGHRRLSIIDLATGDQPIGNESGSVQVIFNGEIYNFAEVRRELIAHGHRFRTNSDTEVIAHGYEQWGEHCVDRFRGMFAFAVWDANARRLLLARDRLGVKPLYYAAVPGGIVFGSEIKSLLEDPEVPREWRAEALERLSHAALHPAPATIYRGIHKPRRRTS